MSETCEVVPSCKGSPKICVNGFLMVRDKRRQEVFYWCCEKRKSGCKGRAVTVLTSGEHCLRSSSEHNHAAEYSSVVVAKCKSQVRLEARSGKQARQIIRKNIIQKSPHIRPYLPSENAVRKLIARERQKNRPPEPQYLSLCSKKSMGGNEFNGDISRRAEVVKNWEDFLNKYMNICNYDEYDEDQNPNGYINLGTAVNNMCSDIVLPRLTSQKVWSLNTDMMQYREGYGIMRLRKAVASIMTEFMNPYENINPEDLFFGVGVTACIDVLAHCLADPGDVILAPTPIYGRVYTDIMQRSLVNMVHIPIITEDNEENHPQLTLAKVQRAYFNAISKKQNVRGILLINPNNPLGDIYSPQLLMEILCFCNEHNLHVIVDEVYALSVFNHGKKFHSVLEFSKLPDRNRTHVLYGISKDFGVAGVRIGAIHTQNEALKNCLKQLLFFQNIPFPVMDMVARFLEDLEWCKNYVSTNQERLTQKFNSCAERLKEMGLSVRDSEGGFFLWVDLRPICGSNSFKQERDFFHYLMDAVHLYVVPGEELFCAQPGWFRLTFTSNPDHVDEGLNRLEKAIKNYTCRVELQPLVPIIITPVED